MRLFRLYRRLAALRWLIILWPALLCSANASAEAGDLNCLARYAMSGALPLTPGCMTTVASNTPGGMGGYACLSKTDLMRQYCGTPQDTEPEDSCPVADPVYPASGVTTLTESDYTSGSDTPLLFTRTYRSAPFLQPDAGVGLGWFHNWQRQLDLSQATAASQRVQAYRGNGARIDFETAGNGLWRAPGDAGLGLTQTVAQGVPQWVLTDREHGDSEVYSGTGTLLSVRDAGGRATTLTYSDAATPLARAPAPGLLLTITNPHGIALQLHYDARARVTQIVDATGTTTRYGYDDRNRLESVTRPNGYARHYVYEDPRFWSGLTGITDESGRRIVTYAYDARGRAIAASHPDSRRNVQFAYSSGSTTVTTPTGNMLLTFIKLGGVTRPSGSSGATGTPTWTDYDATGRVSAQGHADGSRESFLYDAQGREVGVTRQVGNVTTMVSTRYADAQSGRPALIAAPGVIRAYAYNPQGWLTGFSEAASNDPTGLRAFAAQATGAQTGLGIAYDTAGRLDASVRTVNGTATEKRSYVYDAQGNLKANRNLTDSQAVIVMARDAAQRPVHIKNGLMETAYLAYDLAGHVTSLQYASLDNVHPYTLTVRYTFAPDGQVAAREATVILSRAPPVQVSAEALDAWFSAMEDGVLPSRPPATGLPGPLAEVPAEPGLQPVCVECLIPALRPLMGAAQGLGGLIRNRCKPAAPNASAINWGRDANQTWHTERHLVQKGIPVAPVKRAIAKDLAAREGELAVGGRDTFTVTVDGIKIDYSAYRQSADTIRVGSIMPPR